MVVRKTFHKSKRMCYIVRLPILAQQKRGDGRGGWIKCRCGIVFQEMEEREGGEKEWTAPKGDGIVGEPEGQEKGGAKGEAEQKGAERDCGGRFGGIGSSG